MAGGKVWGRGGGKGRVGRGSGEGGEGREGVSRDRSRQPLGP